MPDVQTLEACLVRFANDLGFGIISGVFVIDPPLGEKTIHYLGNTPAQFRSASRDPAMIKRDPVMCRLKQFSAPLIYDRATYVEGNADDLWEIQAQYGYKTGVAMSLHLPEQQHFVLGVDRDQPLPSNEMRMRMMADFHLFATHALLAAQRLFRPKASQVVHPSPLTKREIEILKWTTEGKSSWAVGRILSISEHTVNFHVQRVLVKLAVASKHQAAAKAKSLGLI